MSNNPPSESSVNPGNVNAFIQSPVIGGGQITSNLLPPASAVAPGTMAYQSGNGVVHSNGSAWVPDAPGVNVLDFPGADPTGLTDSTAAINAADVAATAAGQVLLFPPGTYSVNQGTRLTMNGCSWRGAGKFASVLKSAAGLYIAGNAMVTCNTHPNVSINDLGFDTSLITYPASVCFGVVATASNNFNVDNCAFTGIQANEIALRINSSSNWAVTDSYFNQPIPSTTQNQAISVGTAGTGPHKVCRNICVGTAIFDGAGGGTYEENIVSGWLFGGGITLGAPPSNVGSNSRCIGNYLLNGGGNPDVNGTYGDGIECWSQGSIIVGNHCIGNMGAGISVGAPNCTVVANECLNNSQNHTVNLKGGISSFGKLVSATVFAASGSIIANNELGDTQGSPTQLYGYVEFQNIGGAAPLTGILVSGNIPFNNTTAPYLFASATPAGQLLNGSIGLFGVTPPAQPTGYGTPTGNALIASFNAATITLPQLAAEVAQLVIDVKKYGVVAA